MKGLVEHDAHFRAVVRGRKQHFLLPVRSNGHSRDHCLELLGLQCRNDAIPGRRDDLRLESKVGSNRADEVHIEPCWSVGAVHEFERSVRCVIANCQYAILFDVFQLSCSRGSAAARYKDRCCNNGTENCPPS